MTLTAWLPLGLYVAAAVRIVTAAQFAAEKGAGVVIVDGQMIGAVGVSGVAGNADENCAVEGLKAAFGEHVVVPAYPEAKK